MGVRWLRAAVPVVLVAGLVAGSGWAQAAQDNPPGDPPGNNGRIKVDNDSEADPNNEPHIDGCTLWLEFFGFDTEEEVRVIFEAQPPTAEKNDPPLLTWEGVASEDPPAGSEDKDNVIPFNLSDALGNYEPHEQQGYHVKVSWNSVNAPGGSKHKVFWIDCATAPPGSFLVQKAVSGTDPSPGPFTVQITCSHAPADTEVTLTPGGDPAEIPVPMGTTCAVSEENSEGAAVTFSETPSDGADDGSVEVTSDEAPVVTVINTFSQGTTGGIPREEQGTPGGSGSGGTGGTGVSGAQVAGETLTAPEALETLPRTGSGTGSLAWAGAWAVVVGGLALIATRRR